MMMMMTIQRLTPQLVINFAWEMEEALKAGESYIINGAKNDLPANSGNLSFIMFPCREGPEQAEHMARVLQKNPEIVIKLFEQAFDEIKKTATSMPRINSDGEFLGYHFPTDLTHPFNASVDGVELSFLLTWEKGPNGHNYVTLYTYDAR